MSSESEEPKIFVDEDWKTKVEREKKEALEKSESQKKATAGENPPSDPSGSGSKSSGSSSVDAPKTEASEEEKALPPASLPLLVTSLATQAMGSMGQLPGEDGEPLPKNLSFARHFIDLIGMLEEKTKGNVTDEEEAHLRDTLYQLRMMYVAVDQ